MTTFHTAGEGSAVAIAINTDLVRDDVGIAVDDLRALTDGKEEVLTLSTSNLYRDRGACGKPRVVPHNRRPQRQNLRKWGSEMALLSTNPDGVWL